MFRSILYLFNIFLVLKTQIQPFHHKQGANFQMGERSKILFVHLQSGQPRSSLPNFGSQTHASYIILRKMLTKTSFNKFFVNN